MKKQYLGLIVLLAFGLFSACQNEKQNTEAPETTENDEAFLDLSDKGLSYDDISFYEVGLEKRLQHRAVPGVAQAAPGPWAAPGRPPGIQGSRPPAQDICKRGTNCKKRTGVDGNRKP